VTIIIEGVLNVLVVVQYCIVLTVSKRKKANTQSYHQR
jgi:hypothetical protein